MIVVVSYIHYTTSIFYTDLKASCHLQFFVNTDSQLHIAVITLSSYTPRYIVTICPQDHTSECSQTNDSSVMHTPHNTLHAAGCWLCHHSPPVQLDYHISVPGRECCHCWCCLVQGGHVVPVSNVVVCHVLHVCFLNLPPQSMLPDLSLTEHCPGSCTLTLD